MDCRTIETCNLKRKLGFTKYEVINTKEQTILGVRKEVSKGENMRTQYSILGYKIDLFLHDCKLAIEVNEVGHSNKNIDYEIKRRKAIEKYLDSKWVRINPDEQYELIFLKLYIKYTDALINHLKNDQQKRFQKDYQN